MRIFSFLLDKQNYLISFVAIAVCREIFQRCEIRIRSRKKVTEQRLTIVTDRISYSDSWRKLAYSSILRPNCVLLCSNQASLLGKIWFIFHMKLPQSLIRAHFKGYTLLSSTVEGWVNRMTNVTCFSAVNEYWSQNWKTFGPVESRNESTIGYRTNNTRDMQHETEHRIFLSHILLCWCKINGRFL